MESNSSVEESIRNEKAVGRQLEIKTNSETQQWIQWEQVSARDIRRQAQTSPASEIFQNVTQAQSSFWLLCKKKTKEKPSRREEQKFSTNDAEK